MKNATLLLFYFFILISGAWAQNSSPSKISALDLTLGSSFNGVSSEALAYKSMYGLGDKRKFYIGFGLRATAAQTNEMNFITAPAKVSEGNFFKPQNPDKLDTLVLGKTNTFAFNAAIYLGLRLGQKFLVEFSIDAIGFTVGNKASGNFFTENPDFANTIQTANPTSFNLLLTGDYDLGSLNSEIGLNYLVNENFAIRPGITFLFTEYTTASKLTFDNDRFRNKSLMPSLSASYMF